MSNIQLLDCTLRDGGYINEWNFGYHTIKDIIRKMIEANVDYVEVGFLRDCVYDRNVSLFNNCAEIANVLPPKDQRGNTCISAMALHNKYDLSKLEPYDGQTIDAIRVTFHDYDIDEGLSYIENVMKKGYKVFCNPINIMGYSDEDLLELIKKVNKINPYAFSIVDTFGSMMKSDLLRIYSLLEHNLNPNIIIGLHLHENLGLAFSLSQEFISMKASGRKCVIDGSMFGMGRVPGNLCIELIMNYLNQVENSVYDVNPVFDGIDDYIAPIREKEPWGYNTAYALSAKYNLHRNYAEFLLEKGRLRAKQINQILASIEENRKSTFDKQYIISLYESFQNREVDDSHDFEMLRDLFMNRNIIVLAPGKTISDFQDEIEARIDDDSALVISANFIPEQYKVDMAFFSNYVRFSSIDAFPEDIKVLVTSNLLDESIKENLTIHVLNYLDLSVMDRRKTDNCVIMLLRLLIRIGCAKVAIAGFDGYSEGGSDYVSTYLKNQHTKGNEENCVNASLLEDIMKRMKVEFLTPSKYVFQK